MMQYLLEPFARDFSIVVSSKKTSNQPIQDPFQVVSPGPVNQRNALVMRELHKSLAFDDQIPRELAMQLVDKNIPIWIELTGE